MDRKEYSVSVDVEDFFWPRPPFETYFARINEDRWGISKIMEVCEKHNAKATFFVDVENVEGYVDELTIKEACKEIDSRGHEVALHTHPPIINAKGYIKDRLMFNYDYKYQYEFIMKGIEKINRWIGKPPVTHRAGSYAANKDTFRALEKAGIQIDSSVFWGRQKYEFICTENQNRISNFLVDDILEVPVTAYDLKLHLGPVSKTINKKTDINWISNKEFEKVLDLPQYNRIDLFLHSYSLLNLKSWEVSNYNVCNFSIMLAILSKKYENRLFKDSDSSKVNVKKATLDFSAFSYSISDIRNIYLNKLIK